jgi:PAS domain S-box-containing protein
MSLDTEAGSLVKATLECNRMVEGVTNAYYGFLKTLPEGACARLERRLDLGKYYSMGFLCRGGLYGVVTIACRKGTELANRELVEAFVRQASVALLRRVARQRQLESEARYRAVVESQQELVCRFRSDGTHLVANGAYCRFFGLDPATVPGSRFAADVPAGEQEALRDYFRGFSPTSPDGMIEHRVRLPGGTVRWLHWSDRAFFGPDGTIREFQSVGRDVTERKEAEAALAALTAGLEGRVETATAGLRAANRNLEAFSHHVSHDLRAPLRAIDGYLGIMMQRFGSGLEPEAAALVGRARDGVSQANRFLEGLLSLSRLSHRPLNLEEVEPGPIVQAVLDELLPDPAARRVEVTVGSLPPCRADPEMLRHVWQNLLSNALKFTRTRDPARIEIDATGERDAVYSVRDNGVGFPPGEADRVFDDFARLHDARVYEGSGIGLPLVRRIVERHGGRVWADGEGETVVVTIWPSHEVFDRWIATPERDRLTDSAVHRAVDFRPITRYDVVGGYFSTSALEALEKLEEQR